MVKVRLDLGLRYVDVDKLTLVSKNEFWKAFFEFEYIKNGLDIEIYKFDTNGISIDIVIDFLTKLNKLYSYKFEKNKDIVEYEGNFYNLNENNIEAYFSLVSQYGGIVENIFFDEDLKDYIRDNFDIQNSDIYSNYLDILHEERKMKRCDNMIIYNMYYDDKYINWFDKININGNVYKAWIKALEFESSKIVDYNIRLNIVSQGVMRYINDILQLLCLYNISCLKQDENILYQFLYMPEWQRKEDIRYYELLRKFYYIRQGYILFKGINLELLNTIFPIFDNTKGYKIINDNDITIYGIDKLEDNLFIFLMTKENILIDQIPKRSKTGLSRKLYNERAISIVNSPYIGGISLYNVENIRELGIGIDYEYNAFFENKDIEDIINNNIKTLLLPYKAPQSKNILINIKSVKKIIEDGNLNISVSGVIGNSEKCISITITPIENDNNTFSLKFAFNVFSDCEFYETNNYNIIGLDQMLNSLKFS